jgi:RHS repeat-associated protein
LTERQGSYTANERLRLGGISQWIGYPSSGHGTGTYSYAMYDPMGNVCGVTNYNATAVTNFDTAGEYGTEPTQSGELNWQGGSGYQYRSGTGIYQVGARTYDPKSGRFLQQDPLSFGMGDYTYANNNPANFTDPTGLWSWSDFKLPKTSTLLLWADLILTWVQNRLEGVICPYGYSEYGKGAQAAMQGAIAMLALLAEMPETGGLTIYFGALTAYLDTVGGLNQMLNAPTTSVCNPPPDK